MASKRTNVLLKHVRKILTAQEIEQLTDRELLRRFAQERDEAAFAALVRRHGPMILHACQRVLHNWHDAEDAFQATFLVLARKAGSRKWEESVSTWLYLVAYRLALKIQASRVRPFMHRPRPVEHSTENPLEVASDREVSGLLDEELSRLPEKCRAPLVLCSLEGFTRDEAARHLGWSLGTFRRRLEQGRALLRQRLERRGLPVSAVLAALLGSEETTRATVPLALTQSAVQMGMQTALGKAVPGAIVASRAAVLAEGVMKGMWFFKAKIALAAVLVLGIAGAGAGFALQQAAARKSAEQRQPESQRSEAMEASKPPEPEQLQIAEGTGRLTISGIVFMPDGSPAAGAVVSSLAGNEDRVTTVRTNLQGRFRLTADFGFDCRLHAHSADMAHQTTLRVPEVLARQQSATPIEMKLIPAREHVVTVTTENTPVQGAQVAATGFNYQVHGVTDKEGKAKLQVPSGALLTALVAWHPRFGAAGLRDLDHGIAPFSSKLALLPPRPHTIRVVDTEGRAVPNLRLGVAILTDASSWILTGEVGAARARTDTSGNVICPWFPQQFKAIDLDIRDNDPGNWKIDEMDRSKSSEGLTTLHVRRKRTVQGRLVMPRDVSAEGLLITGFGFGPHSTGDLPRTRANRDGSFTLRVASDHGYALSVADREWASDVWTGMILLHDQAEPARITLEVYPATPLTVRVTRGPQHQPVANAWIDLNKETEFTFRHADGTKTPALGGGSTWLQADSNGVASAGLGKGKYRLRLGAGDWQEEQSFQVTANQPVSVRFDKPWLDKRKIAGRLFRDNAPHKPSKATTIRVWPSEEENGRRRPVRAQELSEPVVSPDGRFEITIDAREVSLLAIDPEQRLSGFAHLHQADSTVNLPLVPTAIYSGVLVDEKRQPLADRTLRLIVADSATVAEQDQLTDRHGRFQFEHVPANVPLQLQIQEEAGGRKRFAPLGKRFFLPGENRENRRIRLAAPGSSVASASSSKGRPDWLKDRLQSLTGDARFSAMRVLVILQGDSSRHVSDTVRQLLDFEAQNEILCYLPLVISPHHFQPDAATFTQLGWQRPQRGEIVLLAFDGDGRQVGSQHVAVVSVDSALEVAKSFLKQHAPPVRDARVLLKEGQTDAKKTGRRVWIVISGPRCGPCFRLARWMEDQHALLAKDFVVLKLMDGLDKGASDVSQELKQPLTAGIPWMAITEPDGTLLVTSDGPLGNLGFPTSFEDLRHLRDMLARTAQRLTAEERERIVQSLSQSEE